MSHDQTPPAPDRQALADHVQELDRQEQQRLDAVIDSINSAAVHGGGARISSYGCAILLKHIAQLKGRLQGCREMRDIAIKGATFPTKDEVKP